MRRAACGVLFLLAGLLPLACTAPAPLPAPVVRADPPPLIPLSGFFANREANWGYRVYVQDRDGDENQHVYLADTERPEAAP